MKKTNFIYFMLFLFATIASCKKEDPVIPPPEFTSFTLEADKNPGLQADVVGEIQGKDIFIRVPNSVDIQSVKPSFSVSPSNSIVYVGSEAQQSGITAQDFSKENLTYRVQSESGQSEYSIKALKNASILSFGFFAEDNPDYLFKNYEGEIKGLDISVQLPINTDVTSLKARFTTSSGAEVKVNGQVQTSASNAVDYSESVTFEVSDSETTTPEKFVVTISRLTAPTWAKLPMGALSAISVLNLDLAIHPITHSPYLVYTLPASAAPETIDRKIVAAKYTDSNWAFVGSQSGFSAHRADNSTIAFDSKGDLFAAYKDYDDKVQAQKASVQKFSGDSWSYVGSQQFTDHRVNHLSIAIGTDDKLILGYDAAFADAGLAKRAPYSYIYDGQWSGSGLTSTSQTYFTKVITGNDGAVYFLAMDMSNGIGTRNPSVYKWGSNSWQAVGNAFVSPTEDLFGAIAIDGAANKDGEVYIVYQSQANTDKKSIIMHYDGTKWTQLGDEISITAGSNAERDNIAVAVHPDGTVFLAYSDASGLYVTTFDEQSGNWSPTTSLSSEKGVGINLEVSKEGIVYLATTIDGQPIVYKYDIPE